MLTLKQMIRTLWHGLLRLLPQCGARSVANPKRILIINGAHIGDVVIATSLLPVLKSAFPKAEIGFLTASWTHAVVRHHPDVTFTHTADHWRMNRQSSSWLQKRLQYWKTRRRALKEIRSLCYDVSISLHPWRADFLPLTWQAQIPVRVAFSRSLFAPLATVLADYPEDDRLISQGECQVRLLRALGIAENHIQQRRSSLAPSTDKAIHEVSSLLGPAPYHVIHMGAGLAVKEPPVSFWRDLASSLSASGQQLLFTGKGAREAANIERAIAGIPNCVSACDKLSWDGFVAAIRHAQTLYGVDSMASHVAAAVGTKCVAMFGGMTTIARWRPEGQNTIVWSNAVPCSPCQRQHGCASRICMEGFVPHEILQVH